MIKCNDEIESDYILFNLDYNSENMKKCLQVVRNYIVENDLMIVGGMSIDFAMKVKGDFLYTDYQIPDYDVVDPDNITHANNIASILCKIGMKNISIVPAVHKTTVRVQLMGYTVFDSTFVPKYLYDKIPFMKWDGYKFIDPVYQKIDQYTSLSLLWNITGPTFNAINRFKKDVQRKDMLNKYYIFSKGEEKTGNDYKIKKIQIDKKYLENIKNGNTINSNGVYSIESDYILHGKLAYCMLYEKFTNICKEYNIKSDENDNILVCKSVIQDGYISFDYYGQAIEIINYGDGFEDGKTFNNIFSKYNISNFTKKKNQG